ncbi:hypothetical protein GGR58DRAFT_508461 [Xylaria digitata]|nr:hypothetical protein GGR58DRAFT_508461 [Xylaria digitata]
MADDKFERDIYDLNYERNSLPVPYSDQDGEMVSTPETEAVRKVNRRRARFNKTSKDLRHELERKDAFFLYLHFLMCSLDPALDKANIAMPRTLALARPDTENEEEIIRARLAAARDDFMDGIRAASLKFIGKLVAQIQGYIPRHEEPRLFYRVSHAGSYTFFDNDVGFCCARWLQERDFGDPSRQDFIDHMEEKKRPFASPYISLTESPYRALRFGRGKIPTEVFIIDAVRLRAKKVHTERTTILASRYEIPYKGPDRTPYITESHWLAQFWVPADCIVKRVPFYQFKEVCEENEIFDDDRYGLSNDRRLDINAFKKKHISKRVYVGFGDEEDLAVQTQTLSVTTFQGGEIKYTHAYPMTVFGGPVAWKSSKQTTVTTSTTEAELLALSQAAKIAIYMEVRNDNIDVQYTPTKEMAADGLAKLLAKPQFEEFIRMIALRALQKSFGGSYQQKGNNGS